ncbi:MAG: hypothetical protein IPK33_31840 [Gemmatimonadetes bacterium]|nr:hypothetical protein [Gemmatimonadota bacterium]
MAWVVAALAAFPHEGGAQEGTQRYQRGRFTVVAFPRDEALARSLLAHAAGSDSFPGLPTPGARLLIQVAPDRATFRQWIGDGAPEWGAAFAVPAERRIVMQGSAAPSSAGDPIRVLRHELAHLALHEYLGPGTPRWFDEGYASFAAGEWDREQVIATNIALAWRGVPSLAALDSGFYAGSSQADASYALAHRAVAELSALDPQRGLSLLMKYWKEEGDFERALRRAYGLTQGQFEQRFRDRTRRRYGGLALATDATIAALIMVFVVGPFYVIRRRRDKARLAAMLVADAEAERRERESAVEQLLREVTPTSSEGPTLSED